MLSIVDADSKRIFADSDAESLGKKNSAALDRIYAVAERLSGLTKKDIEELAKNSGSVLSEDSTSS